MMIRNFQMNLMHMQNERNDQHLLKNSTSVWVYSGVKCNLVSYSTNSVAGCLLEPPQLKA